MMTSSNGNIFGGHWPFMWGIHWSPVNSPHKGQWCEYLMWSAPWTKGWVNHHEAGDLRCHHVHYDVIVMKFLQVLWWPTLLPIHTCIVIRLQNKVIFLHNTHKVHSIAHQRGQGMDLNMFGTRASIISLWSDLYPTFIAIISYLIPIMIDPATKRFRCM